MHSDQFTPSTDCTVLLWATRVLTLAFVVAAVWGASMIHKGLGLVAIAWVLREAASAIGVFNEMMLQAEYGAWMTGSAVGHDENSGDDDDFNSIF